MKNPDFDITYALYYQRSGSETWYPLSGLVFEHGVEYDEHGSTTELNEAIDFATMVRDGKDYPRLPGWPPVSGVTSVQLYQRIVGGGPILTFGEPVQTRKTDENDVEGVGGVPAPQN